MIIDGLLVLDPFGTALAASGGASANTIDLLQNRDLGQSEVTLVVVLTTALAGGPVTIQVQTSPDNATWTTIEQSGPIPVGSVGDVFQSDLPLGVQRYIRLNYSGSGITAGAVQSQLKIGGPERPSPYYPRNYSS